MIPEGKMARDKSPLDRTQLVGMYVVSRVIREPQGNPNPRFTIIQVFPTLDPFGGAGFLYAPGLKLGGERRIRVRYSFELSIHYDLGDGWYTCSYNDS
jgi:hypothetical protein